MEYTYQAKTRTGEFVSGSVRANTELEAVGVLQGKDLIILSIEEKGKDVFKKELGTFLYRIRPKDVATFTRQFATLLDADIPVVDGLRSIGEQSDNPLLAKVINDIANSVDAGMPLSKAFGRYPKYFSRFYISLLKAGETAGRLHQSLLYMADYLEEYENLKSKTRGALAYPAFIVAALIGVSIFLMIYVMPQILLVLKEAGVEDLPFTTKLLITTTNFVNEFLYVIIIVVVFLVWFLTSHLKTEEGRELLDRVKIKIPILKDVTKGIYIARISDTLSTLMKSGVQILEALRIAGEVVGNNIYADVMFDAEKAVAAGGSISAVFGQKPEIIPPLVTQMIAVGERTGKIDFMLEHLSKFYKRQSESTIQNLSTLIEPILILIIGIAVAIIVSSVLLPIYNLVSIG